MKFCRLFVLFLLLLQGCGLTIFKVSSPVTVLPEEVLPEEVLPEERFYLHTVRYPEENLPMLADWYTGDPKNWLKIKLANCTQDVMKLRINGVIRLPSKLVVQINKMPRDFILKRKLSYRLKTLPSTHIKPKESEAISAPEKETPMGDNAPLETSELDNSVSSSSASDELIDNIIGNDVISNSDMNIDRPLIEQ